MAGDHVNGPLIAVVTEGGEVLAKEGSLTAGWDQEWPDTVHNAAGLSVAG